MAMFSVSPEDVLLGLKAASQEEVVHLLCEHLAAQKAIVPGYEESLLEREENYPTGLVLGEVCAAIPHTDPQYARTTKLVVAALANPVAWKNMEDPDEQVEVSVVVLSLFDKPEKQLEALQKIMGIIQDQSALKKVLNASNADEVVRIFN